MAKMRVHLTFPENLIKEPVIYNMVKKFDIVTNIRRANVEQKVGWVLLEIEGSKEALEAGVKYARDQGVQVDLLEGDVMEA